MNRFRKSSFGKYAAMIAGSALTLGVLVAGAPGIPKAKAASTGVMIVEVFNGAAADDEWITLANVGTQDKDLSGWKIQDYSGSGKPQQSWGLPGGTVIKAKSLLVVERTSGVSHAAEHGGTTVVGGNFNIARDSDRVDLIDSSGNLTDGIAWGGSNITEGFRLGESIGQSSSFERQSLTDTDSANDWQTPTTEIESWTWAPLDLVPDPDGPSAQAVTPADGAVNAAVADNLTVVFDKPVNKGKGSIKIRNLTDNAEFLSIPVQDAAVSVGGDGGKALIVNPPTDFEPGKLYEITVPVGAVKADGKKGPAKTWSFTTVAAGNTTPAPAAARIVFDNTTPSSAKMTGSNGAVMPGSDVKLYGAADKQQQLASAKADAGGAFSLTWNNAADLKTVYLTATESGKNESAAAAIHAKKEGAVYEVTVTSVTDGDTVHISPPVLGETRVRMLSIDTPEKSYQGQSQGQHATDAANKLAELVPAGTKIQLELGTESKDAYGRLLGHIHRSSDNMDVNKEMIRTGHAVMYYIWPNIAYLPEYSAAGKEAKDNGRGIWNPSNPLEELPYEFRFRVDGRGPNKYVGDYTTKKYYAPEKYKSIPVENRVFFFEGHEPAAAGYTSGDGQPDIGLKTIAEARKGSGAVKVRGEVTAVFSRNAWIQDTTGGARLFGDAASNLTVGDEVEVIGAASEYNGDWEIKDFSAVKLNGDTIPPPQPLEVTVSQVGEDNEGKLIRVKNAWISDNYNTSAGGVYITDGSRAVIVYDLNGNLKNFLQNLPKGESSKFDFIGPSSVYGDTRQMYIRTQADVIPAGGEPTGKGAVKGSVKAEGRSNHDAIEIVAKHQGTGQETAVHPAADGTFTIQALPEGAYTLSAKLKHYFSLQTNVTVQAGQEANAGNLAAAGNGGTAEGTMRAGNTYAGDQEVNIYDAAIVGANTGKSTPEALSAADINGDGAVNEADLELVRKNFLHKHVR
ncbi:thermonuclease family protein [Paenibacillus hamazuiensis]|uniref:thermonuclease family protein n=1 Tax=Paenibacillus hamazuiensis TaxID=2936508 RepID=UPI00200F80B4|nr:thermonuclease family protein [Paenibacillus hamazuiensis]